jgi:hypothetical protein
MHTSMILRIRVVVVALVVGVPVAGAMAAPALADHQVCVTDPATGKVRCWVVHDPSPGHGGRPGGGGGNGKCQTNGMTIPCYITGDGPWDAAHQCYATPMDPPPPFGDPLWQGHTTGTIYRCTGGQGAGIFWSPTSPPGPPPAAVLAQRAETMLQLPTMKAGSNGGPSHTTYVGIPTWLWLPGEQWHTLISPPAAVGGRSVTAMATPTSVSWSMGNGSSMSCNGPGAPFSSADPNHPPCGYTYRVDSAGQPQAGPSVNDRYFTVQGTVKWSISWACTGNCDQNGGDLPALTRQTTSMPLRVFQVETVVTDGH